MEEKLSGQVRNETARGDNCFINQLLNSINQFKSSEQDRNRYSSFTNTNQHHKAIQILSKCR